MPTFIDDNYTLSGYVKAPRTLDDSPKLFEPLEFEYRVATRMEVIRHDVEMEKLTHRSDDAESTIKAEMTACKFAADHVKNWELKDRFGNPVPVSAESMMRLNPALFLRIYRIVRNAETSDAKPNKPAPPSDAELQKN